MKQSEKEERFFSFIEIRRQKNPDYKFIPHLEYFQNNCNRWDKKKVEDILQHINKPVPEDIDKAWEVWRRFRSAQAEISAIYLIEQFFRGEVKEIEACRSGTRKTCDFLAEINDKDFFIEVKAQSGQQKQKKDDKDYSYKHPLCYFQRFEAKFEDDFFSWLFEKRESSRSRKPMRPMCQIASVDKKADVLVAMTDIFYDDTNNTEELASLLLWPDCSEGFDIIKGDNFKVHIATAGVVTLNDMYDLKEIWIFDNVKLNELLIIKRPGQTLSIEENSKES